MNNWKEYINKLKESIMNYIKKGVDKNEKINEIIKNNIE